MNIIEALADAKVLAPALGETPETWRAWLVYLRALFGLPIEDRGDLALYRMGTGRERPPTARAVESWVVSGRRSGKSWVAAVVAVFLALFEDDRWKRRHVRGELLLLPVISADRAQSRVVFRYVRAILEASPLLAPLVVASGADFIELANGVRVEIRTASYRSIRGYKLLGAVLDEVGFWFDELGGRNPAREIVAALRPAIEPGGLLVAISSAGARDGLLFDEFERHYGKEGDPSLVWKSDTLTMNPSFDREKIERAMKEDPAIARAEYYSEFRDEAAALLDSALYDACAVLETGERPVDFDLKGDGYHGFIDPSGGLNDGFGLSICHVEERASKSGRGLFKVVVCDVVKAWPAPFSPPIVVIEAAALLHRYGVDTVHADRYAGQWPVELFRSEGVLVKPSEADASELYLGFMAAVNGGQVELPADKRLRSQFLSLTRRASTTGKDRVTAPRGAAGHADAANALAGAVFYALTRRRGFIGVF